jgi:hypothetical protein
MSNGPATTIVLVAGSLTFVGEWYWEKKIDWKVPLATVLLAAGVEGLSAIDRNGATIMSVMVFLAAATTKYNGHSATDMVTNLVKGGPSPAKATKKPAAGPVPNALPDTQPGGQAGPADFTEVQ